MKKMNITDKTIIYVLCPAYNKSGGPELLHQLVFELKKNNINAYITYYDTNDKNLEYRNKAFDIYTNEYKLFNDIEDNNNNIVIMPEGVDIIKKTKKLKKVYKVIWWLSVDNFLKAYRFLWPIKLGKKAFLKAFFSNNIMYTFKYIRKIDYHLCQSQYAVDFLNKKGIKNVEFLSDYLNDTYLKINNLKKKNRENIVLYNPRKGFKFTKKIIEQSNGICFVPLQNMTTEQVKEILLKSKVYIDFGNHPGKDRFPREAAMCGCCVITGKRGSAKYHEDVPIGDEFKFEDKKQNIKNIITKIEQCISNYDKEVSKFSDYKLFIKGEKTKFEKDVKNIFVKNQR